MVIEIERRFGITITDDEAAKVTTPGQLIDLVTSKWQVSAGGRCASQRCFYLVRKAFRRITSTPHLTLSPDSRLSALCGPLRQDQVWRALQADLRVGYWPDPARPDWAVALIGGSALIYPALILRFGYSGWVWGFCLTALLVVATRNQRRFFPTGCRTVRQLCLLAIGAGLTINRADVAEVVRSVVLENLELRPEHYREDARFVQDLGMS